MLLRTLQLGAFWHDGRASGRRWSRVARYRHDPRRYDAYAAADELGKRIVVLRVLIEDFGGEATGASLRKRLFSQAIAVTRNETPSLAEIRTILAQLGDSGALALEDLDGDEVIARITGEGASLAYAGD